jgi:hypothetical protein
MALLDKFVRSYTDKTYKYTTLVRHQGVLIGFAMDSDRRIYYAVLNLQASDDKQAPANSGSPQNAQAATPKKKSPLDVEYWSNLPVLLPFPREMVRAGYGAINPTVLSSPPTNGQEETDAKKAEASLFVETTARLSAQAAFQVLSDGDDLYLFRQAVAAQAGSNLVDRTLLCDRYLLVGSELKLRQEVRYQRSRSRSTPQSDKDSLDSMDLDGNEFFEPTQELEFINNLADGRFSLLLLPTQVANQQRWQIFAYNDKSKTLDLFNLEQANNGLFSRSAAPPVPTYDPPAEYALKLDGSTGFVTLNAPTDAGLTIDTSQGLCIEAWVQCDRIQKWARIIELSNGANNENILLTNVDLSTTLRFGVYSDSVGVWQYVECANFFETGKWLHVAVAIDVQGRVTLYKNGIAQPISSFFKNDDVPTQPTEPPQFTLPGRVSRSQNYLGKSAWGGEDQLFAGSLDEVRVWTIARSADEIKRDQLRRINGDEAGLVGYWRCNEGSGTQVYDASNSRAHGSFADGVSWSVATVTRSQTDTNAALDPNRITEFGIQPDVRLSLEGRAFTGGISAALYYQQEQATTGYDQTSTKPLKQSARVMLATTSQGAGIGSAGGIDRKYVTLLDMGVSNQGKLAKLPPSLKLEPLPSDTTSTSSQAIAALKAELATLQSKIENLKTQVQQLAGNPWQTPTEVVQIFPENNYGGSVLQSVTIPTLSTPSRGMPSFSSQVLWQGSVKIPAGVSVKLSGALARGMNYTGNGTVSLSQDTPALIDALRAQGWQGDPDNFQIVSIFLELTPQYRAVYEQAKTDLTLAYQLQQTKITELNAQIQLSSRLMPLLAIDPEGLTATGGIADFAWTDTTPQLFDSATGQLTLYFQGADGQFFSAYYQTITARAQFFLTAAGIANQTPPIAVICTARAADAAMDQIKLSLDGIQGDRCMFTITAPGGIVETWANLPRDPAAFAAILSGQANQPVYLGKLSSPIAPRTSPAAIVLHDCVMQSLSPYGTVQIGDRKLELSAATTIGTSAIATREFRTPQTFLVGTPVYLIQDGQLKPLGSLAAEIGVNQPTTQIQLVCKTARPLSANAILTFSTSQDLTITVSSDVEIGISAIALNSAEFPTFVAADTLVYYLPYNYAAYATSQVNSATAPIDLSAGSRLLTARDAAATTTNLLSGTLINPGMQVTPEPDRDRRWVSAVNSTTTKTPNCCWATANTGGSLALNGSDAYLKLQDPSDLKQLSLPPNFTLETWIKPKEAIAGQILAFSADAANSRDGDPCAYQIGIMPDDAPNAYRLQATQSQPSPGVYLKLFGNPEFKQGMTFETWVYFDSFGCIFSAQGFSSFGNIALKFVAEAKSGNATTADLVLDWRADSMGGGNWERVVVAPQAVTLNRWIHLAFSIDAKGQTQLYRDGVPLLSQPQPCKLFEYPPVTFWEGVLSSNKFQQGMQGGIDDIRLWDRGRSHVDISTNRERRLFGNESGLIQYWYATDTDIDNKRIPDRVLGRTIQESYVEGFTRMPSPMPSSYRLYVAINVGINDRALRSTGLLLSDRWSHLAMTFQQAYGIQLDGNTTYLDCGNDTSLNVDRDLTLEAFVYVDNLANGCGLLAKGKFNQANTEDNTYDPTYSLWITSNGQIAFSFKDGTVDRSYSYLSSSDKRFQIKPKKFYKIAVTRSCMSQVDEIKKDGMLVDIKTREYTEIRFYLDGVPCGTETIDGKRVQAAVNNQPLVIGRAHTDSGRDVFCNGILAQVRLANVARTAAELQDGAVGGGTVSLWKFTEAKGQRAQDFQGSNHATFKGECRWTKTPDPKASPIRLYANGEPIKLEPSPTPIAPLTENQFVLGAAIRNGNPTNLFKGAIEETRIWKTIRTPEQILDNVFRQLMSEQDSLLAYYPYGLNPDTVLDESGNGNTLAIVAGDRGAVCQPSDAPISLDAPQVRNAIGGSRTALNALINSAPAVHEYADLQYTSDGDLLGIFKRCYSYIQNGQWNLLTGFKVGDMSTEWIGQVQFAPQIIGYIEGAPPVPSENLTLQDTYNEASSIELQSAQSTNYTYDATTAGSFLANLEQKTMVGMDIELKMDKGVGLAALFALESSVLKVKAAAGLKMNSETDVGGSETNTRSKAKRVSQLSKMTLQGTRENADAFLYKDLNRRYLPKNVGFALVQSETADVFALRLKHKDPAKRVLISYQLMPNPDIPKDWNIINFPINPRYTKQGTLDGKVGLNADLAYPNAKGYNSDRSYFKPKEAYALKNEIDKQDQRLKSMYDSLSDGRKTRNLQTVDFGKTNVVNTYVWTADGGLFTESADTLEVYKENFATSCSFKLMGGITGMIDSSVAGFAMIGETSAMAGFQIRYSESKTRESQTSFNLNVEVNPERDIYLRDVNGYVLDLNGEPKKQAGKVDAYRFMTFYLEPSKTNFDRFFSSVVDPLWLAQSKDPNANALREAKAAAAKRPPCWRIFHRVTYVSRVLPDIPSATAPLSDLEQTLTTIPDVNSNYELIQKLDPYVRNHKGSLGELEQAIAEILTRALPELLPHQGEIVRFMADYYGLSSF